MTNPMDALLQFQVTFEAGEIPVQPGRLDPTILFVVDDPNGRPRFNYMRAEGKTLSVLVMFAQNGLRDGRPVFNIGYAVAETYRGRGLAKSTLIGALAELSAGLGSAGVGAIQIEAVISPNNLASQAVACSIFDTAPIEITDSDSGEPALYYSRAVVSGR